MQVIVATIVILVLLFAWELLIGMIEGFKKVRHLGAGPLDNLASIGIFVLWIGIPVTKSLVTGNRWYLLSILSSALMVIILDKFFRAFKKVFDYGKAFTLKNCKPKSVSRDIL